MTSFTRTFRRWWQPPRRASEREPERSVSFLELFYDLVYVVLIAELAHALSGHVSLAGVGGFAFLFIIVWWAWINGSSYHDIHGNNDIRTRFFTFLQMLTVIFMAIFAHDALGETSVGFALSYAAFQLILTYLWWRTGVHDPDHRPLSNPYSASFLITTILFVLSVFVPAPGRFYLWGLAVVISLLLPLYSFVLRGRRPDVREQVDILLHVSPSLVERFGLFTIIVMGEVIVGIVGGVLENEHLDWLIGLEAVFGSLIAIGLWWIYFDFVSHHPPRPTRYSFAGWMYAHIPMTMGIVAAGAALFNVMENGGEPLPGDVRWLLVGAISLTLVFIAFLMRNLAVAKSLEELYRRGGIITSVVGVLIFLLGLTRLNTIPLLVLVITLMLTPVIYGVKVWVGQLGAQDLSQLEVE